MARIKRETINSTCYYVRHLKDKDVWEYGHMETEGTFGEVRSHVPKGTAKTCELALKKNNMKGLTCSGKS